MSKRQNFTVRHRLPNFVDLNDQKASTSSDRLPGEMVTLNPDDESTKRLYKLGAIEVHQKGYGDDEASEKPGGKLDKDDKHEALVKALRELDVDSENNFKDDLPRREVVQSMVSFSPTNEAIKAAWGEVTG